MKKNKFELWILEKERKCFETNSSSSHSLAISYNSHKKNEVLKNKEKLLNFLKNKSCEKEIAEELSYKITDKYYGWGLDVLNDIFDKLVYLLAYSKSRNEKEILQKLNEYLNSNGFKADWEVVADYLITDFDIEVDGNTELKNFKKIFSKDESIEQFLFNSDSIIILQNDNGEELDLDDSFKEIYQKETIQGDTIYEKYDYFKYNNLNLFFVVKIDHNIGFHYDSLQIPMPLFSKKDFVKAKLKKIEEELDKFQVIPEDSKILKNKEKYKNLLDLPSDLFVIDPNYYFIPLNKEIFNYFNEIRKKLGIPILIAKSCITLGLQNEKNKSCLGKYSLIIGDNIFIVLNDSQILFVLEDNILKYENNEYNILDVVSQASLLLSNKNHLLAYIAAYLFLMQKYDKIFIKLLFEVLERKIKILPEEHPLLYRDCDDRIEKSIKNIKEIKENFLNNLKDK